MMNPGLVLLAFGDIGKDAGVVGRAAGLVTNRRDRQPLRINAAILAPVPDFALPLAACRQFIPHLAVERRILTPGVEHRRRLAENLRLAVSRYCDKSRVDRKYLRIGIGDRHPFGGIGEYRRVKPQLSFRALLRRIAFGQVAPVALDAYHRQQDVARQQKRDKVEQAAIESGALLCGLVAGCVNLADLVELRRRRCRQDGFDQRIDLGTPRNDDLGVAEQAGETRRLTRRSLQLLQFALQMRGIIQTCTAHEGQQTADEMGKITLFHCLPAKQYIISRLRKVRLRISQDGVSPLEAIHLRSLIAAQGCQTLQRQLQPLASILRQGRWKDRQPGFRIRQFCQMPAHRIIVLQQVGIAGEHGAIEFGICLLRLPQGVQVGVVFAGRNLTGLPKQPGGQHQQGQEYGKHAPVQRSAQAGNAAHGCADAGISPVNVFRKATTNSTSCGGSSRPS